MKLRTQKILHNFLWGLFYSFFGMFIILAILEQNKIYVGLSGGGTVVCIIILALWFLPEEHYTQETTIQQAEAETKRNKIKKFLLGKPKTCKICEKPTFERAPLCPEHEKMLACPKCGSTKMYYCKPVWPSKSGQYNCEACQFSYMTFNLFIFLKDDEAVQRVKEKI